VAHGHITVNGRRVDRPSFQVHPGDVIEVAEWSRSKTPFLIAAAGGYAAAAPRGHDSARLGSATNPGAQPPRDFCHSKSLLKSLTRPWTAWQADCEGNSTQREESAVKFTNTITIERPPTEVFAYLAEFENVPRWNYAISQTRKISTGPVGVGSKYLQTRTLPSRSEETFEVIEYEPDRKLSILGTLGSFPAQVTYTLEPMGNLTRLTNAVDLEPPGLLRLVAPVANSRVRAAVAANLRKLKEILEGSAPRR
jgi:uncharacterized protein YndB with AHSA1/START domain